MNMTSQASPVILMAMANDSQHSLRLADEERSVRNALADAHDQKRVAFHSLGHTILQDIFDSLNRFHRQISVFHYCGHSESKGLNLEDGDAQGSSLSQLLGMAPNLKLVFLNGCSNQDQVKILQDAGVKAIIATSAPINDNKALVLAQQFYQALAIGKTIQESYDTAKAFLQNSHPDLQMASTRSIRFDEAAGVAAGFPWDLYYTKEEDLQWRLAYTEQLDETLAKSVSSVGGAAMQLDETIAKETVTVGGQGPSIQGLELETTDRRVENAQGVLRIEAQALLGRGPNCDIVILSSGVSRSHARFLRKEGQMILSDENSTNGTFWNGTRISQMPIREDGVLRLDDVEFKVRVLN